MLNEQFLRTNKRKRLNREGWEAAGALWELQELFGAEELVNAIVHILLHFDRAGALFGCFGLPARLLQCSGSQLHCLEPFASE